MEGSASSNIISSRLTSIDSVSSRVIFSKLKFRSLDVVSASAIILSAKLSLVENSDEISASVSVFWLSSSTKKSEAIAAAPPIAAIPALLDTLSATLSVRSLSDKSKSVFTLPSIDS